MADDGRVTPIRPNKRLIIELGSKADVALTKLVDLEGRNKTDTINRAILVYEMVMDVQREGQKLYIGEADGTAAKEVRIL